MRPAELKAYTLRLIGLGIIIVEDGVRQRALIRCCFGVKVCILQRFNGKRVLFKIAAASA